MSPHVIRILSDIHFGDQASRVRRLAQLRPLLQGIDQLVLNGDTLDTRPGSDPRRTSELRSEVLAFFARESPATTFLTGNHDADLTPTHALDLADGLVFAVHGDILFEDIVPWSRDVPMIRRLLTAESANPAFQSGSELDRRLAVWRRVAAQVPQRHQSEKHPLKYALRFAADTVWPPLRGWRILRAWREGPLRAAELLRRHRPSARFIVTGHTHRPGVWQMPGGVTAINTGSFCPPLGGYAVDLTRQRVVVRKVLLRHGEFYPAASVAEFALAEA